MQPLMQRRALWLGLLLCLMLTLLVARVGYLQLVHGEEYEELATGNRIRMLPIPAPRGDMLDREGETLVTNRLAPTIYITPMDYKDEAEMVEVLEGLEKHLGQPVVEPVQEHIEEQQARGEYRLFDPIRVATDIGMEELTRVEEDLMDLPGVVIEQQPLREYRLEDVGAHIFGYVREIDSQELELYQDEGYRLGDLIGKTGLERSFDQELRGKDGSRIVEVDASGRPIRDEGRESPREGQTIQLTLDSELQVETTRILRQGLGRLRGRSGAAVVLDVETGAILALVSEPGYDPNTLVQETLGTDEWAAVTDPELKPQLNRATSGDYPPGSTFKMVTALAGLEEGVITPGQAIRCTGAYWRVEPKRCWNPSGHGSIAMERALAESCNVYFYDLGYRTGVEDLTEYARKLGLGQPQGLRLHPEGRHGFLATPEWREDHFNEGWQPGETLSAAIGQGFSYFTPLQMANYTATLCNGGILYRPHLVASLIDPDGTVVEETEPEIMEDGGYDPSNLEVIRRGMLGVTRGRGTAADVFSGFPVPVAGKTGTAQNPHGENHGWFVAFAPGEGNAEVAVAVLVEQGGGGSASAAPLARDILGAYFQTGMDSEENEAE